MKNEVITIATICLLTTATAATPIIKSGVISVIGGEVKPHDALTINLNQDTNFYYHTVCTIESSVSGTNSIVGKVQFNGGYYSNTPKVTFNGKLLDGAFFSLDQAVNTLAFDANTTSYYSDKVTQVIFRNSDNDDSFTVKNCISTLTN